MASQDEDAAMEEAAADDTVNPSTPTRKASPPGMKLRSGRKKRRRSRETTGLTPPDEKQARAKRKKTRDEESEDESMHDADDDDESIEQDVVQAASNAAAAAISDSKKPAAAAAAKKPAAKKTLEPIHKLRMPSQHTPGQKTTKKTRTTISISESTSPLVADAAGTATIGTPPPAVGTQKLLFGNNNNASSTTPASQELESILAHPPPPPPRPSPDTPEGRHDALPRNLIRRTSDMLMEFTSNVQEVTTNLVVPQAERMQMQQNNKRGIMMQSIPPLDRTMTWLGFFLLLHVVVAFAYPLGFNPIGGAVVSLSHVGMSVYGGGSPPEVALAVEPAVVAEKAMPPVKVTTDVEYENPLEPFMDLLDDSIQAINENATFLNSHMDKVQKTLEERKTQFASLQGIIAKTEKSLSNLLMALQTNDGDDDASKGIRGPNLMVTKLGTKLQASKVMGSKLSQSPFPPLIDVSAVSLWQDAPPCLTSSPTTQDAVLTQDELEMHDKDLRQRAQDAARLLQTDPELSASIRSWVRDQVKAVLAAQQFDQGDTLSNKASSERKYGLAQEDVQHVIDKRLEMELADHLGRVDYASLGRGASIVTTGPRATSRSLVDNLPLVNRLAAQWRLRFYGHGPEAALTPTQPVDALGQCWSFEAPKKVNQDNERGDFGTLTVKLPRAISVTSVVLEHVPKELTNQVKSALKEFRVIGYEDPNAMGKPWLLGSYEYNVNHERVLQVFETETETQEGVPIPKLQSVTLAIDTNHGFDYTCLYRFRVHGDP